MAAAHSLRVGKGHVEKAAQNLLGGLDGLAGGEIAMLQLCVGFEFLEQMFEVNPALPDLAIVVERSGKLDGIAGGDALG